MSFVSFGDGKERRYSHSHPDGRPKDVPLRHLSKEHLRLFTRLIQKVVTNVAMLLDEALSTWRFRNEVRGQLEFMVDQGDKDVKRAAFALLKLHTDRALKRKVESGKMRITNGKGHTIQSDGKTVWVNGKVGLIGRFSRFGIDIHKEPKEQCDGGECLYCTHGETTKTDWELFKTKMWELCKVAVPDKHRPGHV